MAYGVIMFYHLHMPLYIVGTFAEYPHKNNYIYFLISIYIYHFLPVRLIPSTNFSWETKKWTYIESTPSKSLVCRINVSV